MQSTSTTSSTASFCDLKRSESLASGSMPGGWRLPRHGARKSLLWALAATVGIAIGGCGAAVKPIRSHTPKPPAISCCSSGVCEAQGHHKAKVYYFHYEVPPRPISVTGDTKPVYPNNQGGK
jgi:hypothetical protein